MRGEARGAAEIGQVDDEGGGDDARRPSGGSARSPPRPCRRWRSGRRPAARGRPRAMASAWISMVSTPYSRLYSWPIVRQGSLPFLRIGTKPRPSSCATAPPRMKPRASMPTTLSMPASRKGSTSPSMAARRPSRIGDQRGDVAEQDARLGIVGNRADQRLEIDNGLHCLPCVAGERLVFAWALAKSPRLRHGRRKWRNTTRRPRRPRGRFRR